MGEKHKLYREAMDEIKLSEEQKRTLTAGVSKPIRHRQAWLAPVTAGACVAACAVVGLWVYQKQEPLTPIPYSLEATDSAAKNNLLETDIPKNAEGETSSGENTDITELTKPLEDIMIPEICFQVTPSAAKSYERSELNAFRKEFELANVMQEFTQESLTLLLEESDGANFNYSPMSFYMACSVLAECTEDEVQQELLAFLGVEDVTTLRYQTELMNALLYHEPKEADKDSLLIEGGADQHALLFANSVWMDDAYYTYLTEDTKQLLAEISEAYRLSSVVGDLQSDALGQQKGQWIQENTNGLLGKDSGSNRFLEEEVFCIINALYFKDGWIHPFAKGADWEGIFTTSSGNERHVTYMSQTLLGRYGMAENSTYVPMRYTSGAYMLLFQPKEDMTPEEVLATDLYDAIAAVDAGGETVMKTANIHISMPSFDITTGHSLLDVIEKLGAGSIQEPGSLDNMFSVSTGLSVGEVKQTVRLKVDHKGTEAAAITVITPESLPINPEILKFCLDSPFGYAIVKDGVVLFVGTVNAVQ